MNSEDLKLDKTPLTFGKYKGQTPDEISESDPGYIVWMYKNVKWPTCSKFLFESCQEDKASDAAEDDEFDGGMDAWD